MATKPGRGRRILIVGGLAVVLLAAAAWSLWPDGTQVRNVGSGSQSGDSPAASGSVTPSPSAKPFPTRESAGLPPGWKPKRTVTGDYWVRQRGTVVEDLRITDGVIYVTAPDVTLRRVEAVGSAVVNDYNGRCSTGLVIEDSDILRNTSGEPVVRAGGYTARNVAVDEVAEGPTVGGVSVGCGPVTIVDTFIRVVSPPAPCGDWHGDGIQGYDGDSITVRNTTIILDERPDCGGTAPFFYPDGQGNLGPVDIDGLLVQGGGYPFRLGMPGSVRNLAVVDGSWGYAPIEVDCSLVSTWQAQVVTLDRPGRPTPVRSLPCEG